MSNLKSNELTEFFNKKTIVSFFLSVLVVFVHVHSFDSYEYAGTLGEGLQFFGHWLTSGLTGVAIRLFFIISGVLFYRNYTYKITLTKYKSRAKSLVVPYLFWSVLYMVLMMGLFVTPIKNFMVIKDPFSVRSVILGIFCNYYYQSFWFIFNLIVFTILSPVIYTLLKNKYVGVIVLIGITVLYGFGIIIPETVSINGFEYNIFWRADSIIMYMVGAYIGIHFFDFFAKKKSKPVALIALLCFVACSVINANNEKVGIDRISVWYILLMLVFCWSAWIMFDLFKFDKKPKEICEYSFMMFALNFYLGVYIAKVLYIVLPKAQIFCLVNLCLTVILDIGFILVFSHLLKKFLPKLYSVITGGRG